MNRRPKRLKARGQRLVGPTPPSRLKPLASRPTPPASPPRPSLPQLVPRIRELRHPRPRRPAHRRRPEARPAPHSAHPLGHGRRPLPQGRQRRRSHDVAPPARRCLHRRRARGDRPARVPHRAAGQLRQHSSRATRPRRPALHRGAPDEFREGRALQPEDHRLAAQLRRAATRSPVTLPAKFPIVLLEGAEGIAVGLATKILPHNFNDLCRAAINHLQGKTFRILPISPRAASPTSRNTTTANAAAR
jgi:hypothetical protein